MSDLKHLIDIPGAVNAITLEQIAQQEYPSLAADTFNAANIQQLTLQKISAIQTEQTVQGDRVSPKGSKKQRRRITRLLTAAAACALIVSLSTGAFAALSTDERLLQVLHADSQSQIGQLDEMHTLLDLSQTANDYTVTVKEAISDKHNAWILIEVQAPENVVLDEDLVLFHDTRVRMERVSGHGYSIYPVSDEIPDDNLLSFILDFSSRNQLAGQELAVSFEHLKRNIVDDTLSIIGEQPLADGPWEFVFEIPKRDSTVSMWQWKQLHSDTQNFVITRMDVSPLSLTLDMLRLNGNIYGQLLNEQPTVYLKDGTELLLERSSFGSGGVFMQQQYEFPYPIDLAQIARIEFCGEKLNW